MNRPVKTEKQERTMVDRRRIVTAAGTAAALAAFFGLRTSQSDAATDKATFEVQKSEAEWKQLLTPAQFDVLRNHGTERPGSSPLDREKRKGTFACAGCDLPLFGSETKYDSGTGWPSFFQPLPNAVGTTKDTTLFMTRTEVHCRRCGGHLGHVFDDGPKPTGLRYCMNGVAMKFQPAPAAGPA
jgi:peptide-methionine (R)-S-oxide reductase